MLISILSFVLFAATIGGNRLANAATFVGDRHAIAQKSFLPLGLRLFGLPSPSQLQGTLRFGYTVEVSDDGSHMAVGAPNGNGGAVFLYYRDQSLPLTSNWLLIWELVGVSVDELGTRISLSSDGRTLAVLVRRSESILSTEVYRYNEETKQMSMLGRPVTVCGEAQGGAVKLGETSTSSVFGSKTWLVVSCGFEKADRGSVAILSYDESDEHTEWQIFANIKGEHKGARFGWAIGLYTGNPKVLQIAVTSPFFDHLRGMVQVFYVNKDGVAYQLRNSLKGEMPGDLFGYAMHINVRGVPSLVVGAPQCDGVGVGVARGCVQVYQWGRPNETEPLGWNRVGATIVGVADYAMFGSSVAITSGPKLRIVTSSILHECNETGLVQVYDVDTYESTLVPIGHLLLPAVTQGVMGAWPSHGFDPKDQLGFPVSLSSAGSILMTGSVHFGELDGPARGNVRAFAVVGIFSGMPPPSSTTCGMLIANDGDYVHLLNGDSNIVAVQENQTQWPSPHNLTMSPSPEGTGHGQPTITSPVQENLTMPPIVPSNGKQTIPPSQAPTQDAALHTIWPNPNNLSMPLSPEVTGHGQPTTSPVLEFLTMSPISTTPHGKQTGQPAISPSHAPTPDAAPDTVRPGPQNLSMPPSPEDTGLGQPSALTMPPISTTPSSGKQTGQPTISPSQAPTQDVALDTNDKNDHNSNSTVIVSGNPPIKPPLNFSWIIVVAGIGATLLSTIFTVLCCGRCRKSKDETPVQDENEIPTEDNV
jgi:hypothetical protein